MTFHKSLTIRKVCITPDIQNVFISSNFRFRVFLINRKE